MQKYSHYFTFGTTDYLVIKESPTAGEKNKSPMTLIIAFNSKLLIAENTFLFLDKTLDLAAWILKMIWTKSCQDVMKWKQQNC